MNATIVRLNAIIHNQREEIRHLQWVLHRERNPRLSADECAICGKHQRQHSMSSGFGVCQIYPIFVSKLEMAKRLAASAIEAQRAETTEIGSVEDESAVPNGETPK